MNRIVPRIAAAMRDSSSDEEPLLDEKASGQEKEVYEWLCQQDEFKSYAAAFLKHHITGEHLLELKVVDEQWELLGVKSIGHRRLILKGYQEHITPSKATRKVEREKLSNKAVGQLVEELEWLHFKRQLAHHKWDFFGYAVFLIVVTVVLFNQESKYAFWYNKAIEDLIIGTELPPAMSPNGFLTFVDVLTINDMWDWMKGVLIPEVFDPTTPSYSKDLNYGGFVFGVNALIGPIRIRQLRVLQETCSIDSSIVELFQEHGCYPQVGRKNFDEAWTGVLPNTTHPKIVEHFGGYEFKYSSSDETSISTQWGKLETYEGGGYIVDLFWSNTSAENTAIVDALQNARWVGLGTRAVIIDMTLYNPNFNLFHVSQIIFEILPTGSVLPSYEMRTLNVWRYSGDTFRGRVQIFAEFLLLAFCVGFLFIEIFELCTSGYSYFRDQWNVIDIVVIVLFFTAMVLRAKQILIFTASAFDPDNPFDFYPFQPLLVLDTHTSNIFAVNAFLVWFKVFKYTKFVPGMGLINRTIDYSARNTASFIIMFAFILIGYACAGVIAFGNSMPRFATFLDTLFALMLALLGDIALDEMRLANRFLGPIYFFSFVILCFFVLLSMFLAILSEAYEKAKQQEQQQIDFFGRAVLELAEKKNKLLRSTKEATVRDKNDGHILLSRDDMSAVYEKHKETFEKFESIRHLNSGTSEDFFSNFQPDIDQRKKKRKVAPVQRKLIRQLRYYGDDGSDSDDETLLLRKLRSDVILISEQLGVRQASSREKKARAEANLSPRDGEEEKDHVLAFASDEECDVDDDLNV